MCKERITLILSNTRFASNLGSVARVLQNFGFRKLLLVAPQCEVGAEARTFAMKGAWLLDKAPVLPDLATAKDSVDFLIGSSARSFGRSSPEVSLPHLVTQVIAPCHPHRMGLVLGSEKNGLSRQELALCDWNVTIPTAPDYRSLNLAQAVAVLAYQMHLGCSQPSLPGVAARPAPGDAHFKKLLEAVSGLLNRMDLPKALSRRRIAQRISKMVGQANLEKQDVDLLLGLLKRIG